MPIRSLFLLGLLGTSGLASAQSVPNREIPPTVLAELQLVENRFEIALAADCDIEKCFSTGCAYVDHAVADRPRSSSLPGLAVGPGPGSVPTQAYLTRARCSFTHEPSVDPRDAEALARRLQAKVSKGWVAVAVSQKELQPLPAGLRLPPGAEEEPEEEIVVEPEPIVEPEPVSWTRELWLSLLPHAFWMIGVVLVTFASVLLIWAWRRVGRESFEEKALLAELERGLNDPPDPGTEEGPTEAELSEADRAFVAAQTAAWNDRLDRLDPASPSGELQALVRELLRAGDRPLLAKAMLQFPGTFLGAFPSGGDVASAKLELADYLKNVDLAELPDDKTFFEALNRHALSASLATQSDAGVVRSLREDFGTAGLVTLIRSLPARPAALLYALGPADEQQEMVRLLSANQIANLADQLLRSNRMDPAEASYLFEVLRAARDETTMPPNPPAGEVSDRGTAIDAAGALSTLLPGLAADQRRSLFGRALERFHGSLPSWYRGIFTADMLFELPREARNDLLLEVEADALAAWMALLGPDVRQQLESSMPNSLRASIDAAVFPSRSAQLALAEQGRRELAIGFQIQLERARIAFQDVVHPAPAAAAE
jgi:hypothetical protein